MSRTLKHLCHILFISGIFLSTWCPAQSVLSKGEWHKFSVERNGVYKINYDLLKKTGIDPGKIDPRHLKLYGNKGGMLPQLNAAPRPKDLTELSIFVKGQEDGVFNKEDYILFYGEGADHFSFNLSKDIFNYESNLYAEKNFYFLTVADQEGMRLQVSEDIGGNFPTITEFNDFAYHEIDKHNELKSGRTWFGEKFDIETALTLKWDIENITENTPIKIVSDVMAQSGSGSTFNLFLNGQSIGEQYVLPISSYEYAPKGYQQRDTLIVNSNSVSAPTRSTLEFKYQYVKANSGRSVGYLDFLLISFRRKLALYGNQTVFISASSVENPYSTFNLSSSTNALTIWDVTNSYMPRIQDFHIANNGIVTFSTETSTLKEFIVFNDKIDEPVYETKLANQDLHSLSTPNLIIVTNPDFQSEAERLALHRQQVSGWSTVVVTTDQVFNEFASGRHDPTAIRDFTKYLYDKNPNALKALLLFGRSSYDYKDRLLNNTNFVPTYESRNSLSPLETYSSDDYFGFLENNEGTWNEKVPQYHTLDIGVGRLPVRSVVEARNIVDKIIAYETNASNFGNWRKQIVFVADDGDGNLHTSQADQLAKQIELNQPTFDTKKIYLDAFPQILRPAGEVSPEARNAIARSVDKGALIINYTGHGNERLWAHERILDDLLIGSFSNKVYPLFVTATCEFGRQDDPAQISSAENCLFRNNSGAIGLVSTARPVNASTNFTLNKAFYDALFTADPGAPLTLGEIFRKTKNYSISGVSNRNFSLLGDPSLRLAMPELQTKVTEIVGGETTDTLKALSHVIIKGEIINHNSEKVTVFSGTLQAVLYDKETEFTTLGNENAPFKFRQWSNALFRGQAKVIDGDFQFEFIVPKNIAYQIGNGKLSLYAYDKSQFIDAGGAALDFVIGKSDPNPGNDITSPVVQLYMGDTTFRNGGITVPNTKLIARLNDYNGINLSEYGIGNSLIAILDDSVTFALNDYYESDVDDFTKGWINYPLTGLTPGRHHIVVKAWDTFNNPGEASISFIVTDGNDIVIESFSNYPNPFSSQTTLFFTHNRSGDDLEAVVSIFDITGRELKTEEFLLPQSDYQVDLLKINTENDLGKNLKAGLYLARLVIRSLSNGSKSELVTKLILTN